MLEGALFYSKQKAKQKKTNLFESSFFFFLTSLVFPAYISTSVLMLLLTAPPKLAPSVNTGVYFLLTSLMKVLSKTGLNMPQDPHLPLNRWVLLVCQGDRSTSACSAPEGQGALGLQSVVAVGHSTDMVVPHLRTEH